jgi:hypothetical protein
MDFEQEQTWRRLSSDGNYDTYYCNATDEERESFRIWVKSLLRSQSLLVEFVKTNGEIRVMNCTLSETLGAKRQPVSHLNETANHTTVTERKKNDEIKKLEKERLDEQVKSVENLVKGIAQIVQDVSPLFESLGQDVLQTLENISNQVKCFQLFVFGHHV